MHLSMHNWMRAEPIDVTIRRLAKYGYKSIEIGAETGKYKTKEVRKLLKENKLRCWGAISLMFTGLDLIQADKKQSSISKSLSPLSKNLMVKL
jgi:sugar phosphate isomerase/epimerase